MIAYLEGKVQECTGRSVILNVHGVGYEVSLPERFLGAMIQNSEQHLYIHSHIREDQFSLFGFASLSEKKVFEMLININGIGPKSALEILNTPLQHLADAVLREDIAFLTKIPGIGRKTAEKLLLELRDKSDTLLLAAGGIANSSQLEHTRHTALSSLEKTYGDVIEALLRLGYDKRRVLDVLSTYEGSADAPEEVILKYCLQHV